MFIANHVILHNQQNTVIPVLLSSAYKSFSGITYSFAISNYAFSCVCFLFYVNACDCVKSTTKIQKKQKKLIMKEFFLVPAVIRVRGIEVMIEAIYYDQEKTFTQFLQPLIEEIPFDQNHQRSKQDRKKNILFVFFFFH